MSKRIEEIDILKGIGIILVIVGHLSIPYVFLRVIFAFHMPVFIICSGIVFTEKKLKNNILHMLRAYLITGLFETAIIGGIETRPLYECRLALVSLMAGGVSPEYRLKVASALWFLPCLICIEIIFTLAIKITRESKKYLGIISILLAALGVFLSIYRSKIPMVWNIDIALILFPFFTIGNMIGKDRLIPVKETLNLSKRKGRICFVVATCIVLFTAFINVEHINIYRAFYGRSILLYYFSGIAGSVCLFCLCGIIKKSTVLMSFLISTGRNTLILLCIHQYIIFFWDVLISLCNFTDVLHRILSIIIPFFNILILLIYINRKARGIQQL